MDVLYFCIILCLLQGYASAKCGFPGSPAHCHVSFSDENLLDGTVATYECERGFELLGPSRRVCESNGKWIPDGIPFCVLNVAAGKAPMQVSTKDGGVPQRALDGSTARSSDSDTCTMTKLERNPWWYVNLLEPYMVQLVRLDFGKSCCGDGEAPEVVVRVGNNRPDLGTNPICNRFVGQIEEGQPLFLPCNPPMPGAFVSVHLESSAPQQLSICEALIYTDQALPIERCPQFRDQPPGSTATYNGKCYIFYDGQPMTFRDALGFCKSRGGTLIDESNPALQGFISWELWRRHRSYSSSQYWMGAVRDAQDPSNWKWINGKDLTVSFWNSPAAGEDCARFDEANGWLWADTNCEAKLNYICQHQPKACGRPEQPPNSTMLTQNFGVGASVEYSCDAGHLLVGPTVRTCLEIGFYDEFPPVCKRIECGFPASILHGNYRLLNGSVSYLSHVQYSCEPGYEMVGRSRLVCDIDERWNGPPPRCEVVQCEEPANIANGKVILANNSTAFGSVAEYICAPGFKLKGVRTVTCQASGLWSDSLPSCILDERITPTTTTQAPTTPRLVLPSRRPFPTPFVPSEPTRRPRPKTTERSTTNQPTERLTNRPTTDRPTTKTYERPPVRKTSANQDSSTHVPHIIVANHAKENQIHSDNILEVETPGVYVPSAVEGGRRDVVPRDAAPGPRLNVGAVVALASLGVLIFLIALSSTMVILCKSRKKNSKKYQHQLTRDCNTEPSLGSSSSESRSGLNRYYAQAWEQLHDEAAGGKRPRKVLRVSREEPRDAVELVVSETFQPARRHHHHHHHRDSRHNSHDWPRAHNKKPWPQANI